MPDNLTITNVDIGSVILKGGEFNDEVLTVAGGTYPRSIKEGTILARDSVTKKMIVYVIGGATNDNGIPKMVLTYDVDVSAAGDVTIRSMMTGVVRSNRLIVDVDGDNSNITPDILDELRDYSLVAIDVNELNILDNQ